MNFLKLVKSLPRIVRKNNLWIRNASEGCGENFDASSRWIIGPILRDNLPKPNPIFLGSVNEGIEKDGENYSSVVIKSRWRYLYEFLEGTEVFIIKYIPNKKELTRLLPKFYREKNFYEEFWPQCEQHLDNFAYVAKPALIIPKYYHGTPEHIIIMSDLTQIGFRMISRRERFDAYHSRLVMESLGKLHAASIKVMVNDPTAAEQDMTVFKEELNTTYVLLYRNALNSMARQVNSWKSYEKFADRLREYAKNMDKLMALRFSGDLKVRLHGDCWGNNMMFHYDEFKVVDKIAFIDFQMSHWGSPVIDLLFFLNISTQKEIMFNDLEQMIEIYYTKVSKEMERLNLDPNLLTREALKKDLDNAKSLSVVYRLFLHIIHMCMKGAKFDFVSLLVDGDSYQWRQLINANANYVKELLDDLDQKKLL